MNALPLMLAAAFLASPARSEPAAKKLGVYLFFNAGDPNLQADIEPTIDGMEEALAAIPATEREKMVFLVQVDAPGNPLAGRYRIIPDTKAGRSASIAQTPSMYLTGSVSTSLDGFLAWAEKEGKAESRVLILGGHGTAAGASVLGGAGEDPGDSLPATALAVHLGGRRPYDVIAFENCLTQTLEILYELKDTARYLVGSQEVLFAFDYKTLTDRLAAASSPADQAKAFIASYKKGDGAADRKGRGHTLSAVRSDRLQPLAAAVKDWSLQAYKDCLALINANKAARHYAVGYGKIPDTESKDLGDMMGHYAKNPTVAKPAEGVRKALKAAVEGNAFPKNGSGIAIFLPTRVDPNEIAAARYASLRFVREGHGRGWLQFLRSLNIAQSSLGDEENLDACPATLSATLKRKTGEPYAAKEAVDPGAIHTGH